MIEMLQQYEVILASQSPRRKMLFESLGFPFVQRSIDVEECFPETLKAGEIPSYLAQKKANAVRSELLDHQLLITADTVVWIGNEALNKPQDLEEARLMLRKISHAQHSVFTAFCLCTKDKAKVYCEETKVWFNALSEEEINHYLTHYRPLDKAGAYGIQEFIGLIGIQKVEGDFYNVVGFPMQRFWKELHGFLAS